MTDRPRKTHDGLGNELEDDRKYLVQDSRTLVGNCILWWRPNRNDYTCDAKDAGIYTGAEVRGMRESDVPWPVSHVNGHLITHVRGDTEAFRRRDPQPSKFSPREVAALREVCRELAERDDVEACPPDYYPIVSAVDRMLDELERLQGGGS